jgi:hypothetical protein
VERKQERARVGLNIYGVSHFLFWLGDSLYGLLAQYGVDTSRLSLVALLCLLGGTLVFSRPGAVSPKVKQGEALKPSPAMSLSWWEALKVSMHYFTPVDIPMGSEWVPAEQPIELRLRLGRRALAIRLSPSTYAALFLTLAGWVLVPLGIAALTGLLRRSGP